MTIFNELDHRLSVVKRWGILHTIQTQSVAEHCHNVVRIAHRIATDWFDVVNPKELLDIVMYAHHHDDIEAVSGDLPSMVKPYIDEKTLAHDHRHLIPPYEPPTSLCKQVVKLADMLEGYHFLCIEAALGNQYAENHWGSESGRILGYVRNTFHDVDKLIPLVTQAMQDMRGEKSTRYSMRGR